MYLRFLDALDVQSLFRFILRETLVKSASLLNSEKTQQLGSERAVLKNVGSWLGSITLARDHPIKHKNLSFKDLLIEGYNNNRLIVAIPFVCKTLEPASPFHVTSRTVRGATTMRGTDAFRSPRSASVCPSLESVALRTRYGPPTSTVAFVPNCQNASNPGTVCAVADRIVGAQNVATVVGSAKRTSYEEDSQTVTSPAEPGRTAIVVLPAAVEESVN